MGTLAWIVAAGVAMSAISLVGSATLLLRPATLTRVVSPLLAFAAGSLLAGAFLHLLPAALRATPDSGRVFLWTLQGFAVFFALEQFLHWHHCRREEAGERKPLGYLILVGDGLHNFLDGVGIAGALLMDVRVGATAWLAVAAHEVPQELGDFAALLHAGWSRRAALLWNFGSGLTFLFGGLLAYAASSALDVAFLLPFAAGSFLYIGASDLVPEINKHRSASANLVHLLAFLSGIALLWALQIGERA